MDRIQTFTTPSGDEMVVLPKRDYDRLIEDHDQDPDIKKARQIMRRVKAGTEPLIPLEVYKMIRLNGMSRLRAWRTYRGITGAALAKKIGKSQSYIVQVENGDRKGTVATLSLIANALGTTLDALKE